MKSNLIVRIVICTVVTGSLFSCSKEKITEALPAETSAVTATTGKFPASEDQAGLITGQIRPVPTKAKLVLFDTQGRAYGPFYPERYTGNIKIAVPAAGVYKLVIEYPGTSGTASSDIVGGYITVTREVKVVAGSVTDLGVIYL
jgi:hypothetical protein